MKKSIKIGTRIIAEDQPCFIIAEAGVNHNGDIRLAKKMIAAAKQSGADAVKFQSFIAEEIVTKTAPKAEYQKKNDAAGSQYEMLKRLELTENDTKELLAFSKKQGIIFLSTPTDVRSANLLYQIGVKAIKISSGDLTNLSLIKHLAGYGLPLILSTGMAYMDEVKEAVEVVKKAKNDKLILLHCTTDYPAKFEELNLRAINTMRELFKVPLGYSDHSEGIEASIAARALGACIIEKHFTLSRKLKGPDHKASIEPDELKSLVKAIRKVESGLGSGIKAPTKQEKKNRRIVWRSMVAANELTKDKIIKREDIMFKRPGTGIMPKFIDQIIGKKLIINIKKDQLLKWADFQK